MGNACCSKDDLPAWKREMLKDSDSRIETDKYLAWETRLPFGTIHIDQMREFILSFGRTHFSPEEMQ